MLALSQIAFLVVAVRVKHDVILVLTSAFLVAIAGFTFLLGNMVS